MLLLVAWVAALGAIAGLRSGVPKRAALRAAIASTVAGVATACAAGAAWQVVDLVRDTWLEVPPAILVTHLGDSYVAVRQMLLVVGVVAVGAHLLAAVVVTRTRQLQVAVFSGIVLSLGSLLGAAPATDPGAAFRDLDTVAVERVGASLDGKQCDPCPVIAWGLEVLGRESLNDLVPEALPRAKTCVAHDLAAIAAHQAPTNEPPCGGVAPPLNGGPQPSLSSTLPDDREQRLRELLSSPLAHDPAQRLEIRSRLDDAVSAGP